MKVSFTGNGYVLSEKIQMSALYRCAELAREAKKPYLVTTAFPAVKQMVHKQRVVTGAHRSDRKSR